MTYVRGALSGVAAILLSLFLCSVLPGVLSASSGIGGSRATGLAVVAAGLVEAAVSPLFWIPAILFCALFFWAGGQDSRVKRVLLFWVPTTLICVPGLGIVALIGFVFLLSRQG
jgi:hypothetical protein